MELLPSAQSTLRNENVVGTSKNLLNNRNWTFRVVCCFKWKLEFVSNILWIIVERTCHLKNFLYTSYICYKCCNNHLKSICFQKRDSTWSGTNVHHLLDNCHVTAWWRCHMTCWMESSHSNHYPAKFGSCAF